MEIRCTTEDHLELGELTEFQGGLKSRTDTDYAKIITSIKKYGFSFPFFVWSHDGINHVLDGHGRLGALQRLQQQGEQIPALPVVYVDCGTEEAAKNQLLQEIEKLRAENIPSTIIYEDKPIRSEDHPTMKPVKLFMRLIKNSSKEEDVVLDLFGGRGTTIIASQRLKRVARLMELDPRYCDVIRRRWTRWAKENGVEPGSGALE